MRLIDADALLAAYDSQHHGEPGKARKLIENAPTVDAVPVVRCKDCDNWYGGDCGDDDKWHSCSLDALLRQGNWFCAGGRRRCG